MNRCSVQLKCGTWEIGTRFLAFVRVSLIVGLRLRVLCLTTTVPVVVKSHHAQGPMIDTRWSEENPSSDEMIKGAETHRR